tara:strand:+ start:283 stop:834 length:552 start_codon:yes stop_codon:yes gene_type:complete
MSSYNETLRLANESGLTMYNAIKAHENKTITKRQAQAEKAFLISVDSIYPKFRNYWKSENRSLPDGTPFRGTWAKRWGDINLILSNPENIKRWQIEEPPLAAIEAAAKNAVRELQEKELQQKELEEKEENRLAKQLAEKVKQDEIKRNQIILKPEIIPAVVATSLIPLVIIAFLLINSRKGKK